MNFERYSHFSRRNLNNAYIFLGETTISHKKNIEKGAESQAFVS